MSFTITMVHTPDALAPDHWALLRSKAPGAYGHELRVVLDDAGDELDGSGLDQLLREFLQNPDVQLSVAGFALAGLQAGSALIHSAMVVLISSAEHALTPLRPAQLKLCLDSGPDAGRLIPLRRGRTQIGRGKVAVSVADPAMSRRAAILDIGAATVTLHRYRSPSETPAPLTTEERFQLGATQCRLSLTTPQLRPEQTWPPPDEPVGAKPPEGRNKMMLAFALVPLVAGIVLVLVTGMWFFLLFSGVSAVIASAIFWGGRRQRKKYRQKVRHAAHLWSRRSSAALCSPGELIEQLRAHSTQPVFAGARTDQGPAVRLGTGTVTAQLDAGTSTAWEHDDARVQSAAGITLIAGEQTGITGPLRDVRRLLHWVLVQLALNPFRPQTVLLGASDIPELRDLPQVTPLGSEEFQALLEKNAFQLAGPRVLIATEPDHHDCVQQAASAGWHVVTIDPQPGSAGWRVDLDQRTVEHSSGSAASTVLTEDLQYEGLSSQTLCEHLRLALGHGAAATVPGEIPHSCTHRLPAQLFTDSAAQHLVAALGRNATGAQSIDLIDDGPHLLIAGTSGSGKSELLKTMLTSLCARYSPNELGMVLIDFKGGAAFHHLSTLEHSLGLVTDLSQAAAERTLEGIRSELLRRERLFLDAEVGDYAEYRLAQPEQRLGRILLVIDEFRIFSHELPDQLDELMRLATLGRSLGLHLVLSTQRPQGVVTADIRANIGSSICLRVRSEGESRDVIGSTLAAGIDRSVPGRGVLQLPGEAPQMFQAAQLSRCRSVTLRPETGGAEGLASAGFSDAVNTVREAASAPQHRRRHTPLLPPLPEKLAPADRLRPHRADTGAVLLGRLDDPGGQRQEDLVVDLHRPQSVLLLGEAGSGAAEAAAAAASQALACAAAADVYLLDGDRSLAALAGHPRVGGWLTEDDLPEVEYLLRLLCDEMAERRVGGLRRPGSGQHRPIIVLVSGYAQWHAATYSGAQSLDHLLGVLAAEGPKAGVSVVLCGGRELSLGKLSARIPTKIYLPLGSSEDMRYLWPKLRSTVPAPGRGVLIGPHTPPPGLSVQLVTEGLGSPQNNAEPAPAPQIRVRPLPERITAEQLPAVRSSADGPVVGVEQFSWAPACLPLGPVNLILGARGTGKTSCLQLLEGQLPSTELICPGAPLPARLPEVLLVDEATSCSPEQHSIIQQAVTAGIPVIATVAPISSVFSNLPWAHPARAEGSNVILSPTSRAQADAFAVIIPVLSRQIPGRAVHLRPEGPTFVQWALPA